MIINTTTTETIGFGSLFFTKEVVAAFCGSFFAFIFFIMQDWIKKRRERKTNIRSEHAYLERYLQDVREAIQYNKGLLPTIISHYKKGGANIMDFVPIPIREDITMRIVDMLFLNRLGFYLSKLKGLNLSLGNINKMKDKINGDLLNTDIDIKKRGDSVLSDFLKQAAAFQKVFDYYLDENNELLAENRVLLKKYKNWEFDKLLDKEKNDKRKESIEKELKLMEEEYKKCPMINERLEKLKSFELMEENKD